MKELAEHNEEFLQFGNWNWNPEANVMTWSRGMYVLMDFDPDGAVPEITMEFYQHHVVGDGFEQLNTALGQAKLNQDKTVEFKQTIITHLRSEKVFYTKGKITYSDGGEIKSILGITRDITETSALMDNLHDYKKMVVDREDFLGHGSWERDLTEKKIFWWSDGMYRLFGYEPLQDKSEIVVNDELFKLHTTQEVFDKFEVNLKSALESDRDSYALNYEIKSHTGETKLLESIGKIVRDRTGRGIKILGTTRDVTQLRRYEHDLSEKILELDRLSKELEDSAYAASHDLQEPLRKISTLSDRLQSKFNEVLPEDGKKYIERIQMATKNARLLIDSLLEFSRITHETQIFKKTDLNVLLQEVKADLELKIEETHTTIEGGKLPTLEGSPLQIKQLFSNIILNSIKFKKENLLCVIDFQSRKLEKAEIQDRRLIPDASYYLITIKDNGIGFEEAFSTKIFQMFTRLNGKSEFPGAGIGLALCRKVIENHKGQIFAKSVPDHGALFSIILPEKHS